MGNCMVPLNYLRRWRWENAWIVFSVVALVLLPWSLAFLMVPNLVAVYFHVSGASFVMPFLYGGGWGVAQVLFGLAVVRVGMALAFAITIGLSAALGTLVPILIKNSQVLATEHGLSSCSACSSWRPALWPAVGRGVEEERAKRRNSSTGERILQNRDSDGGRSRFVGADAQLCPGVWR